MAQIATAPSRLRFCICRLNVQRSRQMARTKGKSWVNYSMSDAKAARILPGLRVGLTLREVHEAPRRFEAYCGVHPEYAREANRVIVAVPQLRQTIGPIDLSEYVAWKVGSLKVQELDELIKSVTERRLLPPLR
jgi:hypothetical protein